MSAFTTYSGSVRILLHSSGFTTDLFDILVAIYFTHKHRLFVYPDLFFWSLFLVCQQLLIHKDFFS